MTLRVYVANLASRGMVGTIYVEDHQTLLYTKYKLFLFDLILYIPVNNQSVMSGWVFLG